MHGDVNTGIDLTSLNELFTHGANTLSIDFSHLEGLSPGVVGFPVFLLGLTGPELFRWPPPWPWLNLQGSLSENPTFLLLAAGRLPS